jgi:hypothetical protein
MQAMIAAGLSASGVSVLAACGVPASRAAPATAPTVIPDLDLAIELMHLDLPDGRVLEVRSTGPKGGEILLFHHGTPGAGLPFAPWAQAAAARGLRTVMYSRPGYATSTSMPGRKVIDAAADAARVADALGVKTFRTIGWSGWAACAGVRGRAAGPLPGNGCGPSRPTRRGHRLVRRHGRLQQWEFRLALQGGAALKPDLEAYARVLPACDPCTSQVRPVVVYPRSTGPR